MSNLRNYPNWLWEIGLSKSKYTEASTEKFEGGEEFHCLDIGSIPHLSMFHRSIITGVIGKYLNDIVIDEEANTILLDFGLKDGRLQTTEADRLLLEQLSPEDSDESLEEGLIGLLTTDSCVNIRAVDDEGLLHTYSMENLTVAEDQPWSFNCSNIDHNTIDTEQSLDDYSNPVYLLKDGEGSPFDSLKFALRLSNASETERSNIITNYAVQALGFQPPAKRKPLKVVNTIKRKSKRKAQKKARRKSRA